MKKVLFEIPDMQSAHCQMRVSAAINSLEGATVEQINPGAVKIALQQEGLQPEVAAAIKKAGYTVAGTSVYFSDADAGKTFLFKTNIHCSDCLAKVGSSLDGSEGMCHWDINLNAPGKQLSVHSDGISADAVIEVVRQAGFKIEQI